MHKAPHRREAVQLYPLQEEVRRLSGLKRHEQTHEDVKGLHIC